MNADNMPKHNEARNARRIAKQRNADSIGRTPYRPVLPSEASLILVWTGFAAVFILLFLEQRMALAVEHLLRFDGGGAIGVLGFMALSVLLSIYLKKKLSNAADPSENEVEPDAKSARDILGTPSSFNPAAQDADLTVYAPPAAPPGDEIIVQAIFHTPDRQAEATARAKQLDVASLQLASVPLTVQISRRDKIK
jgi:hypothetical protein